MKITVESTTKIIDVGRGKARVWQGTTESGIPIACVIMRVAVRNGHPTEQFEKELQEQAIPNRDAVEAFDSRMF